MKLRNQPSKTAPAVSSMTSRQRKLAEAKQAKKEEKERQEQQEKELEKATAKTAPPEEKTHSLRDKIDRSRTKSPQTKKAPKTAAAPSPAPSAPKTAPSPKKDASTLGETMPKEDGKPKTVIEVLLDVSISKEEKDKIIKDHQAGGGQTPTKATAKPDCWRNRYTVRVDRRTYT